MNRWRDRASLSYTFRELACGTGYTVGVDVVDRDDNHSPVTSTTVSTSACPDATPPSAPTGVRPVAATENSVMLTWSASSDNVGVVEYGLYVGGLRVASSSDANATVTSLVCGTSYLVGLDAADAAGNRSSQVSAYFRTSDCPSTNKPPSTPTGLRVTAATATSVSLAWTASTDDVAVSGYGLYVSGQRTGQTTTTGATYTGLQCGTTYALGVDAYDNTGKRSTVAELSSATSPCAPPPSTGSVRQTIANGATVSGVVNWRAVYDSNGDGSEDDPGRIEFRVDGNLVLNELLIPFGDATDFWSSTSVPNGQHTFQVRAISDSGTLLTSNTVTATVANQTTPPPPSTGSVRQTIANGATVSGVVNWRAVYDSNGDGSEDDPGRIEFRVDGNLVLNELLIPFGDATDFWSSTSVPNGQHTFQVRAISDSGTLLTSNTVTATVANQTTPPPPSTGSVRQTIANGATVSGVVNWRAVYDSNGDGSEDDPGRIEFRVDGNLVLNELLIPFGDATDFWSSTSVPNGQHTFQVRAISDSGTLLTSNTVTATVANQTTAPSPPPGDTTAPSSPSNLRVVSATATSITIAWNASTDNVGVTGYDVYRATTKVGSTTTTTSYTINGLTCGTAYSVGVRALDQAGNTSQQATMSATTAACADTQPPTAPSNVTASTRTTTSIALTWTAATDNLGIAGYGIYNAGELVNTTTGTTGIVSGLSCATNYTLAVDAFDPSGNSSPKTTIMVSTLPCADTAAPSVTLTAPTNGSTVSGHTQRNCQRH